MATSNLRGRPWQMLIERQDEVAISAIESSSANAPTYNPTRTSRIEVDFFFANIDGVRLA